MPYLFYLKNIIHTDIAVSISDAEILFRFIKKELKKTLFIDISLTGINKISYTFLKHFIILIVTEFNTDMLKNNIHFIDFKGEQEYLYKKVFERVMLLKRQGRLKSDFKKYYYKL